VWCPRVADKETQTSESLVVPVVTTTKVLKVATLGPIFTNYTGRAAPEGGTDTNPFYNLGPRTSQAGAGGLIVNNFRPIK